VIRYRKLLLATGTRARTLPLPGMDLEGVHSLRAIDDVDAIAATLKPDMRIVIIGGGYIGLEVASALKMRGHAVTVIEGAERVMQRVVSPDLSAFFHKLHVDQGVDLVVGTGIEAIEGDGNVKAVLLTDGSRIEADLVLVAVGAVPVTDLAEEAGIAVDNGISVDGQCRTSAPDIYAAGDCASFHSGRFGRTVRLESVQNAIDQGKHAAMAMLGEQPDYDPVPWFWSDQYDVKLQIAGLNQGYDRVEIEGNPDEKAFAVRYYLGDRLLCVDSVNMARAHMLARRELAAS
jgi:3-phenylpropionate/trans-cinnamate dioxygenase ferredoxin reductase subunit